MAARTPLVPAHTADADQLARDIAWAHSHPVLTAVLATSIGFISVLNERRQLVLLNQSYLDFLGIEDPATVLGLRPGDAARCVYALEGRNGCGSAEACKTCGAAAAMDASTRTGAVAEATCALCANVDGVQRDMALRVRVAPIALDGRSVSFVFMEDVSEASRREALERSFLHDMNNLIQGLLGTSEMLVASATEQQRALAVNVLAISERIRGVVALQRALASTSDYKPRLEPTSVGAIVEESRLSVTRHPAGEGKRVAFERPPDDVAITTDPTLLARILGNMLVNALEATRGGGEVQIRAEFGGDHVDLAVWNEGVIPQAVRPRIFHRFFSTKPGSGRGEGTYSMKLFAERYLGGTVSFSSTERDGTEFVARLPRHARPPASHALRNRGGRVEG
jgi:signal transduction histidine kinase